jgi:hypothetical protein
VHAGLAEVVLPPASFVLVSQQVHDSGFDPADYAWPPMVAALLNDDWEVQLQEQRPRIAPDGGAGAHHTEDLVLRARRLR